MLVVTRKTAEKILIPELGVEITLVSAEPGRARIGIVAPQHIAVIREELLKQKIVKR